MGRKVYANANPSSQSERINLSKAKSSRSQSLTNRRHMSIPKADPQQRADALAYLRRKAPDLIEVLGLDGEAK